MYTDVVLLTMLLQPAVQQGRVGQGPDEGSEWCVVGVATRFDPRAQIISGKAWHKECHGKLVVSVCLHLGLTALV